MCSPSWTPRQPEFPVTGVLEQGQMTMCEEWDMSQFWNVSGSIFPAKNVSCFLGVESVTDWDGLWGNLQEEKLQDEIQADCLSD